MNTDKVTRLEIIDHVPCNDCGGDGKEHCTNPDHNFVAAMGGEMGRLGCPTCNFPESTVVINGGYCESCNGGGMKGRTVVVHSPFVQIDVELQDNDRTLKVFIHDRYNENEVENGKSTMPA